MDIYFLQTETDQKRNEKVVFWFMNDCCLGTQTL